MVLSLYFAVPYDGNSRCLLDVTSLYGSPHQEDSDTKASGESLKEEDTCREKPAAGSQQPVPGPSPAPGSAPVDPSPAPAPAAPAVPVGGLVLTPQQVDSLKQSLGTLSQVLGVGGSGAPPAGGHNVPFTVPTVAKAEKVCQVCKRTFWPYSRLRVHMRSRSKTGPKCAKCGKQFTTKAGLRSHLESCGSAGTHICAVCGKRFKSDKSLQAHNADHLAPAGGLPCQYCGSNFKNSRTLKDHESRDCAKSPSYAGPFYCLVANCPRAQGHGDPFRWVKDCNAHM